MMMISILNRSIKISSLKSFQKNFLKCNSNQITNVIQCNQRNLTIDLRDPKISYEFGKATNLNTTYSPLTVGELLRRSVQMAPNQNAIIVRHQNIVKTYEEFDIDTDQLAKALKEIGCGHNSMIAIWAVNCYEWLLTQFAAAKIGAIVVALNPGYKEKELLNCLKLVGVDTLIMSQYFKTSNFYEIVRGISPGIFDKARGHRTECKQLPHFKNIIVIDQQQEIAPKNVTRFSSLMSMSIRRENAILENETQFDDIVNIQFTSGTTGLPKGSMATHHNVIQNIQFTSHRFFDGFGFDSSLENIANQNLHAEKVEPEGEENLKEIERPIICLPNPLYHTFGLVAGCVASIYALGTLVLSGPVFNVKETYETIQKYKCNFLYGTPTMWSDLLRGPHSEYDLSTLKRGLMSGSTCPPALLENLLKTFPSMKNIVIPYGATETGPVATLTSVHDSEEHQLNSVGRPIPFVEIKVIDLHTGRVVPRGIAGEVCIRSHGTFPGYINQPEKTREVVDSNFWYHTGDVGIIDSEGYLIINGRIKEMIIRGGENIYPKEVEELISQFYPDCVEDIQIVGIPDERMGEEMVAYIKLKLNSEKHSPQLNEDTMKSYLKTKMSHFKIPKYIRFVDDYPRTPTGKVKKVILKQMAINEFCLIINEENKPRFKI